MKADGTVQLTTRYGSKPQALAKGKNAFELAGESELVSTLEQIQTAVKQGEFDELIEQQKAWRNRVNTIKAEKPKIEFADSLGKKSCLAYYTACNLAQLNN